MLESDKKYMEQRAETDQTIKELNAELQSREEISKKADEALKNITQI